MVSITDVGDLYREVPIRGHQFQVRGVPVETIIELIDRYPDIRKLMSGRVADVNMSKFLMSTPALAATVIAHAIGEPTPEAENAIRKLSAGEQMELLDPIVELTFRQGVVSFVRSLQRVVAGAGGSGRAPATNSPAPSSE